MDYSKMEKAQLIEEMEALQEKIAELEHAEAECKLAEEALEESEGRLQNLFEAMAEGVVVIAPSGHIVQANRAAEHILGLNRSDIEGRNYVGPEWEIIRPDGSPMPPEEWAGPRAMKEKRLVKDVVMGIKRPDGSISWVNVSAAPLLSEGGELEGIVGTFADITGRLRVEEALQKAHDELETRVEERTAELAKANEALRAEIAERKQAEEQLRQYEMIVESANDALFIKDLESRYMLVNNKVLDLFSGIPREKIVGKTDKELLPLEDALHNIRNDQTVFKTGKQKDFIKKNTIEDKDYWFHTTKIPLRDNKDELIGLIGIARDITERKRVEEALRESKRQLESRERFITSILDSIPTSLVAIDQSLRIVSANRNFLMKTRREERDTLGRKIEEVFPQVLLEYTHLDQKVQGVFSTGQVVEGGKVSYRGPGLPTRIYYYRLIPLKLAPSGARPEPNRRTEGAKETVENVLLLLADITEREQLKEEMERTERHLASVVECANDLVASMDPEGRILTWNRAAGQTSGFKFEEVKGQYLPDLCVEEDQQRMESWLAQLAKGQFTKKSMEINLGTKRGEEVPISWACSRMLDDEHRIVGLVAVGRDLTERKRLEAQLIKSAKLTSLGVMAGGIAHEIRNPLAMASAAAQLLLERPDDEKLRKEAADKIYSGIQRASYIIENLLKFARPPEERMAPVDMSEALEETLYLLTNQLRVQQIELWKDIASDLPLVVGNKSLLQGVFSNLILNACNAMPDGGSLTIATRVNSDNQVEVAFTDTGCGIPKENLSKIFDPFFTTMPVGKGTGLGLSISYSIIKQHHGKIDVESKVGGGSTFTVRLPVATEQGGNAGA